MIIEDFDYFLPKRLIAQQPSIPKSDSKLLVSKNEKVIPFFNLPKILNKKDLLIFNDTKVVPAIIKGRVNNNKVLITLHTKNLSGNWVAFSKPSKKISKGDEVFFKNTLKAYVVEKNNAHIVLKFDIEEKKLFTFLNKFGDLPVPPYIKNIPNRKNDESNYQSIFAKHLGAFASPTASLHFDEKVMSKLKKNNIDFVKVTLHVGAGTFLPLKNSIIKKNKLHSERGLISQATAKKIIQAKNDGKKLVAVGTTVLRLLESCYVKFGCIQPYNENTNLFITPGFKFNVIDKLITNFHLPKSSLLILVSAFAGKEKIFKLYKKAIKNDMRFFSYGDGMLLDKK